MAKQQSWSGRSVNLFELLAEFSAVAQTIKVELLDATFRYGLQRLDQTMTPVGECAIEFIMRKWPAAEVARKGRYPDAVKK